MSVNLRALKGKIDENFKYKCQSKNDEKFKQKREFKLKKCKFKSKKREF